jgi:hypothetical protein
MKLFEYFKQPNARYIILYHKHFSLEYDSSEHRPNYEVKSFPYNAENRMFLVI